LAQTAQDGGLQFGVLVFGDLTRVEAHLEVQQLLLERCIVGVLLFGDLRQRPHDELEAGDGREEEIVNQEHRYSIWMLASRVQILRCGYVAHATTNRFAVRTGLAQDDTQDYIAPLVNSSLRTTKPTLLPQHLAPASAGYSRSCTAAKGRCT